MKEEKKNFAIVNIQYTRAQPFFCLYSKHTHGRIKKTLHNLKIKIIFSFTIHYSLYKTEAKNVFKIFFF